MTGKEKALNTKALTRALDCYPRKKQQLFTVPNNFFFRFLIRQAQRFVFVTTRGRSKKCQHRHFHDIPKGCAKRLGIYLATRSVWKRYDLPKTFEERLLERLRTSRFVESSDSQMNLYEAAYKREGEQ